MQEILTRLAKPAFSPRFMEEIRQPCERCQVAHALRKVKFGPEQRFRFGHLTGPSW